MTDSEKKSPSSKLNAEEHVANTQAELDKVLEEYTNRVGLPDFSTIDTAEPRRILSMNMPDIRKMDVEEVTECCVILARYALIVQSYINHERKWRDWAEQALNNLEGQKLPQLPERFYGKNGQSNIIRSGTLFGQALVKFKSECELKLSTLFGMPNLITIMGERLNDVKYAKMKTR